MALRASDSTAWTHSDHSFSGSIRVFARDGRLCQRVDSACAELPAGYRHAWTVPRHGSFQMHKDAHLLDWATAIAGGGPTWLEIVATHAHLLAASDNRRDTGSSWAEEPRHCMKRSRPETVRWAQAAHGRAAGRSLNPRRRIPTNRLA